MAGEDGMRAVKALPHRQVTLPRPSTASAPNTVNVTASSTAILAANSDRVYALIVNYSDTLVWLALGNDAVASKGIPLAPRVDADNPGGQFEIDATNMFTGAINGIHGGTGNKAVVVQEC